MTHSHHNYFLSYHLYSLSLRKITKIKIMKSLTKNQADIHKLAALYFQNHTYPSKKQYINHIPGN